MTVQIKKKFDSLEKGIENMLDAAAHDYGKNNFSHKTGQDFRNEFIYSLGKKYINQPDLWIKTEDQVRKALEEGGINFTEIPGEAAFYGPKVDVQVWSAIGKEFTLATNQVDFAIPRKFDLSYTDEHGNYKTPLCIHRAPLSTHERFIGFLIEHFGGDFPLVFS